MAASGRTERLGALLESNSGSLYLDRFGEVARFCRRLRPWIYLIRATWDAPKYVTAVGIADPGKGGDKEFGPKTFTAIMKDSFFFAYFELLCGFRNFVETLGSKLEVCPCHPVGMDTTERDAAL